MKKKGFYSFLLTFLMVSVVALLGIFSPIFTDIENKLYDSALQIKPLATTSGKFLNVQVDDGALDLLKMYPLRRSTLADGLLVLKEFGVDTVLLDTQLVDPSTPGMNTTKYNQLPDVINQVKNNTLSLSSQLINAFADGQLGGGDDALEEAEEYISELEWEYDDIFSGLLNETDQIALDYDDYIANIFSFMGNVYVTNDFEEGKKVPEEYVSYLKETQSLQNIEIISDPFQERFGHNPAIRKVMESAKGSGFVETLLDPDGKSRRTNLILRKSDNDNVAYFYPHLSLRSFLDKMGNPKLSIYSNKIVLNGVNNGVDEPFDLTIPLDSEGAMAINWAGKKYTETFDSLNFYELYQHDLLMKSLQETVTKIMTNPNTNRLTGRGYRQLASLISTAEEIRKEGDPESFEEYREYRNEIVKSYRALLIGDSENPPVNIVYREALENFLSQQELTTDQEAAYLAVADEIDKIFISAAEDVENLEDFREKLKNKVEGSIATLGYTATSTFDIGANPFEGEYFNMGIYPTLYNNLLSGEFITLSPVWISVVLAMLFALFASLIIKRNEAKGSIILGGLLFIVIIGLYLGLFVTTGIYIKILIPALSFIIVFIQKISSKLLTTSKDKAFIKNAFGQYLSEDVIQDIINDPSKLKLGGEEKEITAFFTDVKGFSTISEKLTPNELVSLLNEYLTTMSDIALAHKGTIDKYEGDAIIGFFGAPAPLPDHATKAITAAIKMKEIEAELNKKFLANGMAPSPVNTRIGINSGPCVVGNMGTPKKMDYTMMGNDVNIAARLEGVNKQYGTWILTSQRTIDQAEDIFLVRKLDRVRVVGINEPIRLYNPIALMNEATETQKEVVAKFEKALETFENRDWKNAKTLFKEVLKVDKDDKPSIRYIQLCDKFLQQEPEKDWDGVFNLTSK